MPNIPDPPTTVNTTHTTPIAAVNEAESLRTQALESWALVEALVDVLETLPPDLAHERIQALSVACERSCSETFTAAEKHVASLR